MSILTNDASSTASTTSARTAAADGITEDEAKLYDRQLRLWGVEAQNRMRSAHVLLAGSFRGVSTEVAKNIVLAGIGKLTLLDHRTVEWSDLGSGYWEREEDIGLKRVEVVAPRLQLLNPRVQISTQTDSELLQDEAFLKTFDLVVLTDVEAQTISRVNNLTRKLNKKFFAASSIGIHGWVFADLLQHDFIIDQQKAAAPGEPTTTVPLKLSHSYCSFDDMLAHDFSTTPKSKLRKKTWSKRQVLWAVLTLFHLELEDAGQTVTNESLAKKREEVFERSKVPKTESVEDEVISRFVSLLGHEFAPSCAIVGGILGQDVLNAIGGKEEPVRNLMVFDGDSGEGGVWSLGC
ncbi:uncharacterized protein JCM15063_004814 [Sporobolomyces koalae]|uniref:uncharacterized protein n=1 Tax=Sporobolomyces koalae TaxID=500713 RepID=UPI00316F157B